MSNAISQQELEARLWDAANSLRGPVDPGDFKALRVPVAVLQLKWISDTWDGEHAQSVAGFGDTVSGGRRRTSSQAPKGCALAEPTAAEVERSPWRLYLTDVVRNLDRSGQTAAEGIKGQGQCPLQDFVEFAQTAIEVFAGRERQAVLGPHIECLAKPWPRVGIAKVGRLDEL
ncbi:MAG: hypothetical protein ACRD1K_05870 [Acidimicrobiales bacterium]